MTDAATPASTGVTVPEEVKSGLPAAVSDLAFEDAGMGLSEVGREDIAIPFLTILQSLSDQLQKSKPDYIKEAEQGEILNTVSNQRYSGENGIIVIPVAFVKSHIEWKPRDAGGGLVQNYGSDPSILQKATTGAKGRLYLPSGNELVVAANYYVYVVDEATGNIERALIAMSRTQVKHSKRWLAQITGLQEPRPDGKGKFTPPIFYMAYKLTTAAESNDQGTWYTWRSEPFKKVLEMENGESLYRQARDFNKAVMSGAVKAPAPEQQADAARASDISDPGDDSIPF